MKTDQTAGTTKKGTRICLWVALAALPLLVASCASSAMRSHFEGYNAAYADALNQQMLLNLARLQNGHPAYYLVIGAIDDRLTISGSATIGGTGNYTDQHTTTTTGAAKTVAALFSDVFGGNASSTISRNSNPEFQFIPLNNAAVTEQVLEPIQPSVFYTLYQQGYPIDQLMRVMIERVETTLPNPNANEELILVNSPTRGTPESYGKFLRACAILRELQRSGCLALEATNDVESIGPVSFDQGSSKGGASSGGGQQDSSGGGLTGGRRGKPGAGGDSMQADNSNAPEAAGSSGSGASGPKVANPGIKDYSDVEAKGWKLSQTGTNGGWELSRRSDTVVFKLKKDVLLDLQSFSKNPTLAAQLMSKPRRTEAMIHALAEAGLTESQLALATNLVPIVVLALTNSAFDLNESTPESRAAMEDAVQATCVVIELLNQGISIQTKVSGEKQANTRLILRSFGRAMEAVASEQPAFDALVKANPDVGNHEHFCSVVPDSERNPVIRIDWGTHLDHLQPPLQTLQYAGKTYAVTDPERDPLDPKAGWNRDIFRLMVALGSQVTVDISKFQQQVFQLRTD